MKLSMIKLKIRKNSPEILLATGVIAIIGGVITACRATLSVEDVIDDHKRKRDALVEIPEEVNPVENTDYPEEIQKKDMAKLYLQTGVEFVKLYALPIGLTTLGIASILVGNRILKARYLGAVAAYNGVSEAFRKYRQNVIADKGAEKDKEYMYGKMQKKTIEKKTLNEAGDEVLVKAPAYIMENGEQIPLSEYACFFARGISTQWDSNEYYNRSYINGRIAFQTQLLRDRGYVFLNSVLEDLGFKPTKAGSVVGWLLDPAEGIESTNEILVDVHEVWLPEQDMAGNTIYEPAYYIDFPNLSGIIFDKLPT